MHVSMNYDMINGFSVNPERVYEATFFSSHLELLRSSVKTSEFFFFSHNNYSSSKFDARYCYSSIDDTLNLNLQVRMLLVQV